MRLAQLFQLRILAIGLALIIFAIGGLWVGRKIRWQRQRAILLTQRLERAMAPGETIFADDRLTVLLLRHYGDSELRRQLYLLMPDEHVSTMVAPDQEIIIVVHENDALPSSLRADGLSLIASPGELHRNLYFVHR